MDIGKLDSVEIVSEALINPVGSPMMFTLSLEQFKVLYQNVYTAKGESKVDIVLNGQWALIQFAELCSHRIRVVPDRRSKRNFLNQAAFLEKDDFEIAYSSATFYGMDRYINTRRFLAEEIETNWFTITIFIVLSVLVMYFLVRNNVNQKDTFSSANELLIGISSIFFSIFLLYTASQNLSIVNEDMFVRGLMHRFIQVDRQIMNLALIAVSISGVNLLIAGAFDPQKLILLLPWTQFSLLLSHILIISTALAMTIMGIVFHSVVEYYFRRIQYQYETDLSKRILDRTFQERKTILASNKTRTTKSE